MADEELDDLDSFSPFCFERAGLSKKFDCGRTGLLSCPQIVDERPQVDRSGDLSYHLPFLLSQPRRTACVARELPTPKKKTSPLVCWQERRERGQ
jgi:hypothetical protein